MFTLWTNTPNTGWELAGVVDDAHAVRSIDTLRSLVGDRNVDWRMEPTRPQPIPLTVRRSKHDATSRI
jgi:hypothetical protein